MTARQNRPTVATMDGQNTTLEPVGQYRTLRRAQEHALVVTAMGLPSQVDQVDNPLPFVLLAPAVHAEALRRELDAFDREQREKRRAPPDFEAPTFPHGWWAALAWAATLLTVFLWQGGDAGLTSRGASSSVGFFAEGEWWRPFTALFLHGDLHHLLGNLAIGLTFGVLVARSLGPLVGWGLILLSGVLGNLATSWSHYPEPYGSVGASTAVFGGLGVLVGYGVYLAIRAPSRALWASIIAPIGGGVALLGWFGAGGGIEDGTTDVLAHLFGFIAGILLGSVAAWWRLRKPLREARPPARLTTTHSNTNTITHTL